MTSIVAGIEPFRTDQTEKRIAVANSMLNRFLKLHAGPDGDGVPKDVIHSEGGFQGMT